MGKDNELMEEKIFSMNGKFTKQIKIVLPKNYLRKVDTIAGRLNTERRYVIWDAIGNYLQICKNSFK